MVFIRRWSFLGGSWHAYSTITFHYSSSLNPDAPARLRQPWSPWKRCWQLIFISMTISCAEPSSNTETPPPAGMDSPQHKSYMVTLFRTPCQHIVTPSHRSGKALHRRQIGKQATPPHKQRSFTTPMLTHSVISTLAPQSQYKTSRLNSGTFMGWSLPLGHSGGIYHIKKQGGRVLVRNRHFLRYRTPASCVPLSMPTQQIPPTTPPSQPHTYSPSQETTADSPWPLCRYTKIPQSISASHWRPQLGVTSDIPSSMGVGGWGEM